MPSGIFERSESHKENLRKSKLGKKRPPEVCKAISEGKLAANRRMTEEEKEQRRQWYRDHPIHTGVERRAESIKKMIETRKTMAPAKLYKYGITDEQYVAEIAAGNWWCSFKKHFAPKIGFGSSKVCSECVSGYHRAVSLRRNFGKDQAWYDQTLAEQGGGCAICGNSQPAKRNKHLMIDHDHRTEAVRGILCGNCNMAMERIDNVPDFLMKAAAYAMKYKT